MLDLAIGAIPFRHILCAALQAIGKLVPMDEIMAKLVGEGEVDSTRGLDLRIVDDAPALLACRGLVEPAFKTIEAGTLDKRDRVIRENLTRIVLR